MEMSPREFTEEEMTGPTAYADRCQERDDLQEVLPISEDIHRLRRQLEMPLREFEGMLVWLGLVRAYVLFLISYLIYFAPSLPEP